MPSTIGKCKLFRIKHITLLEGDKFLRNKHEIVFFEIKCTFFGRKENTINQSRIHFFASNTVRMIHSYKYEIVARSLHPYLHKTGTIAFQNIILKTKMRALKWNFFINLPLLLIKAQMI